MIRVLGSPKRLCDGLTRRDLLHVGSLGLLGLGLSAGDQARAGTALASATAGTFGRAKSCILLFLYGSPSQLETFDPKPDAPLADPGRAGVDPLERAGHGRLRGAAPPGQGDGQGHRAPLGDAPVPAARGRLRDDGHRRRSTPRWS